MTFFAARSYLRRDTRNTHRWPPALELHLFRRQWATGIGEATPCLGRQDWSSALGAGCWGLEQLPVEVCGNGCWLLAWCAAAAAAAGGGGGSICCLDSVSVRAGCRLGLQHLALPAYEWTSTDSTKQFECFSTAGLLLSTVSVPVWPAAALPGGLQVLLVLVLAVGWFAARVLHQCGI
jgi:hypothetical protein